MIAAVEFGRGGERWVGCSDNCSDVLTTEAQRNGGCAEKISIREMSFVDNKFVFKKVKVSVFSLFLCVSVVKTTEHAGLSLALSN